MTADDTAAAERVLEAVRTIHPKIEKPRHGCCAPPKLCDGHAPECGGEDHGMLRPAWPCLTLRTMDAALHASPERTAP